MINRNFHSHFSGKRIRKHTTLSLTVTSLDFYKLRTTYSFIWLSFVLLLSHLISFHLIYLICLNLLFCCLDNCFFLLLKPFHCYCHISLEMEKYGKISFFYILFNKNVIKFGAAVKLRSYSEKDLPDAPCFRSVFHAVGWQTLWWYSCEKK